MVSLSTGTTVLREGDRPTAIYFLLRGLVRGYYIDDQGNDVTKCFSSENGFFSSEGWRTGGLSTFSIECLEDCLCVRIPYALARDMVRENPALRDRMEQLYLNEVANLEIRSKNLVLMDAQERYLDFCRRFPRLQGRVALRHIASYIGVRAPSLSRIRKSCGMTAEVNTGE